MSNSKYTSAFKLREKYKNDISGFYGNYELHHYRKGEEGRFPDDPPVESEMIEIWYRDMICRVVKSQSNIRGLQLMIASALECGLSPFAIAEYILDPYFHSSLCDAVA